MPLRASAVLLAFICAKALALAAQPSQRVASLDSVSVKIIEHAAVPQKVFGVRLSEVPFLTLGGLHDDERMEFSGGHFFLTAARLSDGRIVVLDEHALKWFDPKGRLLHVSGKRGPGPGEFRSTRDLCVLRSDTVMVLGAYDGRISLWSRTGAFVRQHSRPAGFPPFDTCRQDGTLVVRGGADGEVAQYRVIRPSGAEVARLGPIVVPRYRSPFMTEPYVLPIAQGFVVADARRYEYRVVDLLGRTRQVVRAGPAPRKMSESEWLAAAKRVFPRNPDAALRISRGDTLRTKPAFAAMRVDPLARVWIRDYDKPYGWSIFDAQGASIGRIMLNGTMGELTRDIVRVGNDYAVVRRIGADGEMYLDFHRIVVGR